MGADIRSETGRVLRRIREARGLTLRDVGARSGGKLTATAVAGYERGERGISLQRFCELCELYGAQPVVALAEVAERTAGRARVVLDVTKTATLRGQEGQILRGFVDDVSSLRGQKTETLVLRAGDVEVLAAAAGRQPEEFLRKIEPALRTS